MKQLGFITEKILNWWTVKVSSTTHQSPELLLKRMILITMELKLAMGCDNINENSDISFKYRQCDITTNLMANIQNLQQWAGDEHESTLLYMTSVPNYCNKTFHFMNISIMRQIAMSQIHHLSNEHKIQSNHLIKIIFYPSIFFFISNVW